MNRTVPILFAVLVATGCAATRAAPELDSWRDGATRTAIEAFVADVTDPASPSFVPEAERIAVFDNDGTLWVESPMYTQLQFALDRVRELAPAHPEWKEQEPFKSVLAGDLKGVMAGGEKALLELVTATHGGQTTDEFQGAVAAWLETARHPTLNRRYDELVYQPMLELLAYLRAHGFQTWIVSGGGQSFMRVFAERVYGIPPEQVVGSYSDMKFEMRDGTPVLVREGNLAFFDDKGGKPAGIQRFIGRRPVFAAGNSDGDLAMLQWTRGRKGASFALIVHHTDGVREAAYDRKSHVGQLDKALDEAPKSGFVVVDMARDWDVVFPR